MPVIRRPLSPLEHLVLRLIVEQGEANGSLLCELDESISPASVYKILERLRDRELVEAKRGVVRGTRQPSYYKATAKGKRHLAANDAGRWHVEAWCDWCEHVGIDPIKSWKGEPGKRYMEQQQGSNAWQIQEALDAWASEQRAARRAS